MNVCFLIKLLLQVFIKNGGSAAGKGFQRFVKNDV